MTSTSFNVGLGDGSRSSSRVLRPPGGGHTDIFGGEPEPPRGRRPAPSAAGNLIQGQGDEPAKPTNGADTPTQNGQACEAPQPAPQPAPEPALQLTEPAAPTSTPETRTPEARTPETISPITLPSVRNLWNLWNLKISVINQDNILSSLELDFDI